MKKNDKTREQLLKELEKSNVKIAELKKSETGRKKAEVRIKHLNSILKAIRDVNQLIVRERNMEALIQKACDILVDARGYYASWIGLTRSDGKFTITANSGFREDIFQFQKRVMNGNYPLCIEKALTRKDKFVVMDKSYNCGSCEFKTACYGKKVVIVRVDHDGKLFGMLAISLSANIAFDGEEKGLLREVAQDIAYGLQYIETEVSLRMKENAIASSINAIAMSDMEGSVFYVNSSFLDMWGYDENDVLGEPAIKFWHSEENALKMIEALSDYMSWSGELVAIRKNGSLFDAQLSASVVKDEGGKALCIMASFIDITKHKHAEKALRESEARLNEAQRITQIGSWGLDLLENTLNWSDEVYRIFDLEPQQFGATYEAFLDNIHPDDREFVNNAYTESVRNKMLYDIVHRLLLKDGTIKYVNERCETFYDDVGKAVRSIGTIQDITERKQAEEELEKHRQHLEELVQERTKELDEKNIELKRYNRLFEGREFRIKELRDRVKELEEEVRRSK